MDEGIELTTLEDGAQDAAQIGELVAGFIDAARESLVLALYDIRLPGEVGDRIRGRARRRRRSAAWTCAWPTTTTAPATPRTPRRRRPSRP